jgi:hypothetical protein
MGQEIILITLFTQCQPTYYYQPQYYYQEQQFAQFVAVNDYDLVGQQERLTLSQEREAKIDKILAFIESLKNKPVDQNPVDQEEDPPIKPINNIKYTEDVPPPPPIPITNINDAPLNITTIFKNNCINCHSNKPNQKMNLFTTEGKPNNLTPKQIFQIDNQIITGKMPKKGGPLNQGDILQIREWVANYGESIISSMR